MTDQRTTTDWLMEAMIATEDGFAVYDATGRLVFCNDSFRRINGYTETTAYPGVTYDDLGKVDSQISAPTRPQFTFHQRVASIRENGPIVIEQVYGGRIYARHQSVTPSGGLVSVISDVTALKSAQAEAERANHAKSEFLATMSHEIRTPMAGVMGFADMLLDDPLPGESRDKVLSIKDASRALLAILNDILDVSKLEAGRMEVEDEDFLLAPLLDGVMTLIGETIRDREAKTLDLRCVVADECPPALRGDAARIRQILVNLLGNAVKFTPEGTVTLKVERECDAEGAEWLRFGVRDTGIGIAPEHIEGLFDDFTQADASISRRFEGTGLGLAICRRLVTLMQGEIGVESELGVGSMFWFTLPMAAATTPVSELAGAAEEWEFAVAASRPLRVLVAEDNLLNQQIVAATLAAFGCSAEFAGNGEEAVRAVREGNFEVVLMDVRMPVMSGPDATKTIRGLDTPGAVTSIVALTADVTREVMRHCIEVGMSAVAAKPIDRVELARAINVAMGDKVFTFTPVARREPQDTAVSEASEEINDDVLGFLSKLDALAGQPGD
jgi:signal transduction histidine kinase/DNA-binding NarL/FixJ family response regulator